LTWESAAAAVSSAPLQAVWDVLLDGRRWSFWNPGVEWMWIEGEPVPGTVATVKLRRVRQTAFVIDEITPPHRFAIRVTVGPIARLRLTWTLTPHGRGTRIESVVAIDGVAAGFLLQRPARRVAQAMPATLERLAEYAARGPDRQ
jgi:hypothetical protein